MCKNAETSRITTQKADKQWRSNNGATPNYRGMQSAFICQNCPFFNGSGDRSNELGGRIASAKTKEVGNMEHRYSDRATANLNIAIYKQNLLVALGVVKNIGNSGVFIESGFSELSMNQPLEIEFFPGEKSAKTRRFKAVVVHRSSQGFGVEIDDISEQLQLLEHSKGMQKLPRRASVHYVARPTANSTSGFASL